MEKDEFTGRERMIIWKASVFTWLKESACPPLEAGKPAGEGAPWKTSCRIVFGKVSPLHSSFQLLPNISCPSHLHFKM